MADQIATAAKARMTMRLGNVSSPDMDAVERALRSAARNDLNASLTGGRGCEIPTTRSLRKMRMLMSDHTFPALAPGRGGAAGTSPVPPVPGGEGGGIQAPNS